MQRIPWESLFLPQNFWCRLQIEPRPYIKWVALLASAAKQPGALGALNLATVHLMAKTLTSPGEVVSTDQLESNVAGLIAQMAGRPTIQCYKVVTVFVDHATGFLFVHFQKSSSAKETVQDCCCDNTACIWSQFMKLTVMIWSKRHKMTASAFEPNVDQQCLNGCSSWQVTQWTQFLFKTFWQMQWYLNPYAVTAICCSLNLCIQPHESSSNS